MKIKHLKIVVLLVLLAGMLRADDKPGENSGSEKPAPFAADKARPSDSLEDLLGRHKDLVHALVESLKDSEGEVRETSMYTLGRIGKRGVPSLIERLRDKDRDLRANAAYVLGQLGKDSQEAVPSLLIALKDGDREVRRRAAYALHRIVVDTSPDVEEKLTPVTYRLTWQAADPGLLMPAETPQTLPVIRSSSKPVQRP